MGYPSGTNWIILRQLTSSPDRLMGVRYEIKSFTLQYANGFFQARFLFHKLLLRKVSLKIEIQNPVELCLMIREKLIHNRDSLDDPLV